MKRHCIKALLLAVILFLASCSSDEGFTLKLDYYKQQKAENPSIPGTKESLDQGNDENPYTQNNLFKVLTTDISSYRTPYKYRDFKDSNHLTYKETIINTNPDPILILYRKVKFEGKGLKQSIEREETDIRKDFGKDLIRPTEQISRDDVFFFADSGLGEVKLTVEYCGFRINEKTKITQNDSGPKYTVNHEVPTCLGYSFVLGEENDKKRQDYKKENLDIKWSKKL